MPITPNIIHTAKHTTNANVLTPNTRHALPMLPTSPDCRDGARNVRGL
jgi:hypothetical protein